MNPQIMKIAGIALLIVAVVCVFVAFERYNTNAGNVRVMNNMTGGMPFGGAVNMKPAIPAATKYAVLFAIISGTAGGFLLYAGTKTQQTTMTESEL